MTTTTYYYPAFERIQSPIDTLYYAYYLLLTGRYLFSFDFAILISTPLPVLCRSARSASQFRRLLSTAKPFTHGFLVLI